MNKKQMLAEYIIQDIVSFLCEEKNISYVQAMKEFYSSKTFVKLIDYETGLYLESSLFVYNLYKEVA